MKKTHVKIGLLFTAMLLTACGKNSSEPSKEKVPQIPEKGVLTFNIEFEKEYTGTKKFEAKQNFHTKVTKDIASIKGHQVMSQRENRFTTSGAITDAEIEFYSTDVAVTTMDVSYFTNTKETAISSKMGKVEMIEIATDKQLITRDSSYDYYEYGDPYGVSYMVKDRTFDDISETIDIDVTSNDGVYGVDKQGRNIYYYSEINYASTPGTDKYGNSIDVYSYDVEECLIIFTGDVLTGKPSTMIYRDGVYNFYDDNYCYSEEPIADHSMEIEYSFTFGKRKEYKNKEALLKSFVEKPVISKELKPVIYQCEATVNDKKDTVISIDSATTTPFSSGMEYDFGDYTDDGAKGVGVFTVQHPGFSAGNIYSFASDINYQYLTLDSSGKYSVGKSSYCCYNKINVDTLPEGVYLVKDENEKEYLYSENNIYFYSLVGFYENSIAFDEAKAPVTSGSVQLKLAM